MSTSGLLKQNRTNTDELDHSTATTTMVTASKEVDSGGPRDQGTF